MKPMYLCAAILSVSFAATVFGENLWINGSNIVLHSNHAAASPPVAKLAKGQQVNGLAHDSGWVQIDTGKGTGWVAEASVSTSKVGGDVDLGASAQMSEGAAARGLNPDAEKYVAARNINKAPLESLRQLNQQVQSDYNQWVAFSRDVHK